MAGALTLALSLAACGGGSSGSGSASEPPTDGVLTVGLLNDIGQPADPDVYYAGNGLAVTTNVYEGLLTYQPGTDSPTLAPALATAWEASADNTTFTLHLQEGVTFHDGTPFTSAAIKPSFDRRTAVDGGPAYMVADVASVETPDDLTAVIHLSAPNSAFLDYLASPYGPKMMSPTGLAANAGDDADQTYLTTHDLGTGPYQLTAAQVDQRYQLTAYDGYWGGDPTFTTVDLPVYSDVSALQLALDEGTIDAIVGALPSQAQSSYAKDDSKSTYQLPTFQVALMQLNSNRPFFAGTDARLAMRAALDVPALVKQNLSGKAADATGMYGRGMLEGDSLSTEHDPSLLADYVGTLPADQKSLVIGFTAGATDDQQVANVVAAQLQAIGVRATVQSYPTSQVYSWADDPANAPDVFFTTGTWPDAGNPYLWGHVFWDLTGGLNYLQCGDDRVATTLTDALRTGDPAAYLQAGQLEEATGCYTNLAYVNDAVVTQPWLTGVAEAHDVATPYTLQFDRLGVAAS